MRTPDFIASWSELQEAQTCNVPIRSGDSPVGLSPEPVGSVLTWGRKCQNGAELQDIRRVLRVELVGVGKTHTSCWKYIASRNRVAYL